MSRASFSIDRARPAMHAGRPRAHFAMLGIRARRRSTRAICPSAGRSPRAQHPHRSRLSRAHFLPPSRRVAHRRRRGDLRRGSDEQTIPMISKLAHQPPLLVREFRAPCTSARRLPIFTHCGQLQCENASKLVLGIGVAGNECIGAFHQYPAEINRLCRQAKHGLAPLNHASPHVVQEIGKQRQRAGVFGLFLRRPACDIGGQPIRLEAGRKKRGGPTRQARAVRPRALAAR